MSDEKQRARFVFRVIFHFDQAGQNGRVPFFYLFGKITVRRRIFRKNIGNGGFIPENQIRRIRFQNFICQRKLFAENIRQIFRRIIAKRRNIRLHGGDWNLFFRRLRRKKYESRVSKRKREKREEGGNYVDGKEIGEWKEFYENGKLEKIGSYNNGKETGEWKFYDENEQLTIDNYIDDENIGIGKFFDENKKFQEIGKVFDEKLSGEWKSLHKNGQLNFVGNFKNGNQTGEWKSYHENGQLRDIGNYVDGKKMGEWKEYYENGKINSIIIYKYIDGVRSNSGSLYDKDGKVYYEN